MDAQIKEEVKDTSLCFAPTGDGPASLTLVEKYETFLQNDQSDADSDCELFFDAAALKEEYAQLKNNSANLNHANRNNRLSIGLMEKYRSLDSNISVTGDDSRNGLADEGQSTGGDPVNTEKTSSTIYSQLIEQLNTVRRCGPEGNSIFCTNSELEAIQERYSSILDFIQEKSATFVQTQESNKNIDNQDEAAVSQSNRDTPDELREEKRALAEKLDAVQRVRVRLFEAEQIVKEQVEQLELVERYKMESVG